MWFNGEWQWSWITLIKQKWASGTIARALLKKSRQPKRLLLDIQEGAALFLIVVPHTINSFECILADRSTSRKLQLNTPSTSNQHYSTQTNSCKYKLLTMFRKLLILFEIEVGFILFFIRLYLHPALTSCQFSTVFFNKSISTFVEYAEQYILNWFMVLVKN